MFVYINRGLFIAPYEIENHGNKETNSVIELLHQFATGKSNDIDEDGDSQSDCSYTIFVHEIPQQFSILILFSQQIRKNIFPKKENFLANDFHSPIDQPPEIMING